MANSTSAITCTWKDEVVCEDCRLRWRLGCRFDPADFWFFIWNQIPSLVMACLGLVLVGSMVGTWWPLIGFVVLCVVLWGLGVETRVLCSHCPYWTEDSKILHCWALTGSPKIWRYRPGPMSGLEKATLVIFFTSLVVLPLAAEGYGIWAVARELPRFGLYGLLGLIGVTVGTVLAFFQFAVIIQRDFCQRCVNFSCPLNRVPRWMRDEYLRRNPVMRRAWEASGYRLSDPQA
ncbi:MAG TPA: hypothetical protein ENK08_03180 [Chloroflexi bacterium]|nr:hypothetical protein [Chloroflexota bacterium]